MVCPTCPRALCVIRAHTPYVPYLLYAPYVPKLLTCPTCIRAQIYFTDRKIKKIKILISMKSNEGSFTDVFKGAEGK